MTANVNADFEGIHKGQYITFKDEQIDKEYLKIMSNTDCAAQAKITDAHRVESWSTTRSVGAEKTISITFKRSPSLQP